MSRSGSVASRGSWRAILAAAAVALLVGCTPSGPATLLTDPHEIMARAVRSTAALSSIRVHAEMSVSMAGLGAGVGGDVRATLDADVDLAHRVMAGRTVSQLPAGFGGGQAGNAQQIQEFISLPDAQFSRNGGAGRWTKFPTGGFGGPAGPTNGQIASLVDGLISSPGVRLDLGEAASCSLGTCYHLTAMVDGKTALNALGAALGQPAGDTGGVTIPDLVFDLMIDEATGVLSEVRFQTAIQGTSVKLLATFTNPDIAVQIVAPPPASVDDITKNGGFGPGAGNDFGGGAVTMTPQPFPAASPEP
jgi:hypothetical protein